MVEVPGVGAIVESIKARITQIEEQLRQHRDLSDELERLRDALGRLERGVGERARGAAATPRGQTRAKILEALKDGPRPPGTSQKRLGSRGEREHDAEQARQVGRGRQGRARLQAARVADRRERPTLGEARSARAPLARGGCGRSSTRVHRPHAADPSRAIGWNRLSVRV
jgi:hypothetical protein